MRFLPLGPRRGEGEPLQALQVAGRARRDRACWPCFHRASGVCYPSAGEWRTEIPVHTIASCRMAGSPV